MGDAVNPPFVLTPHKAHIKKAVVVVINSLQWDLYQAVRSFCCVDFVLVLVGRANSAMLPHQATSNGHFPNISALFASKNAVVKCRAPGSANRMYDGVAALMRKPVSKRKAAELKNMTTADVKGVGQTLALLQSEKESRAIDNSGKGSATELANEPPDFTISGSCIADWAFAHHFCTNSSRFDDFSLS